MKVVSENAVAESSARSSTPKRRSDLIHQTIEMGEDPMVVCKDPLSRDYHHFTQSEYELLCLANGDRSTEEIASEVKRRYPSSQIRKDAIDRFFQQAAQQGLLESENSSQRFSYRKKWNLISLLAFRFPGLNPSRLLERMLPIAGVFFSRPVMIASMIATPACILTVIVQFDQFASDFTSITENPLGSVAWIAIGIALAKILHELGHALACRYLNCECPAIGVMLLLGIPCLYADVSDAWMLKRRGHRMLVSAAGMYVECWIAIYATLVWMASNAGPIHDLAVTLMVVCSVSTILINGNPLLRYDGYYLLSDATGIANLASRSRATLNTRVQSVLGNRLLTREPVWMSVYALASFAYRLIVLLTVSLIIYETLQAYDLDLIGILLVLSAVAVAIGKYAKSLRTTRATRTILAVSLLIVVVLFPIPHNIVAPMTIVAANAKEIYAIEPGFLKQAPEFGKQFKSDEIAATLSNPALVRKHAAATSTRDRIETQLQAFNRLRGRQSQSQLMTPSLQKDLEQADAMVDFHNQSLVRLNVTPGKSGTLYPAIRTQLQPTTSPVKLVSEPGAWIAAGTPIGIIGDAHRREAILYLRDREVSRIQLDQQVTLLISDAAKGSIRGRVVLIDTSPCQQFPSALLETGLLPIPSENIYRVAVQLDPAGNDLMVHRIGRAKIHAKHESIAMRIYRLLTETFG